MKAGRLKYGIKHSPRLLSNPLRKAFLSLAKANSKSPGVLANSIPKSGTHLLMQLLDSVPELTKFHDGVLFYSGKLRKPGHPNRFWLNNLPGGCFAMAHLPADQATLKRIHGRKIKTILLVRDPRDVLVSYVRFMCRNPHLKGHEFYRNLPDDKARTRTAFYGRKNHEQPRLKTQYQKYLRWQEEGSLLIRFEDLRGTFEIRRRTCSRLLDHLRLEVNEKTLSLMIKALDNKKSRTFRKGSSGQFQKVIPPRLIEEINESMGEILEDLGYKF